MPSDEGKVVFAVRMRHSSKTTPGNSLKRREDSVTAAASQGKKKSKNKMNKENATKRGWKK